ncbi:MAG: hypothetical protein PHP95_12415 [Desulfuromonadaceae bacterium]|nr:hypothetical protein [Desulfuromonadaceae bacterium]MDD2849247.1 hypothetical protein [Desulfuromonadaceae bacterium]MDD4131874.1 hypothetical protein [Desulfuromonadaceae bacterium]
MGRIGQRGVNPADGVASRQNERDGRFIGRGSWRRGQGENNRYRGPGGAHGGVAVGYLGFVDSARAHVQVGQEVHFVVLARQVDLDHVSQIVGVGFADQRGEFTSQLRGVGEAGLEFDEAAREGRDHLPRGGDDLFTDQVAEIHGQRGSYGGVVDRGAEDTEVDQQPLFVVHDLGLGRVDLEAVGYAVAVVYDAYRQGIGNRSLHLGGKRVVADHRIGHEIIQD